MSVAHELNTIHIITHSGYCVGFEHWKKSAITILITNFEDILKDCERFYSILNKISYMNKD